MTDHIVKIYNVLVFRIDDLWPGLPQNIVFQLSEAPYKPPRGFAHCLYRPGSPVFLQVAPQLGFEHPSRIVGVLSHELGHAVTILTGCCPVDRRQSELVADELGSLIAGSPVRYDRQWVQVIDGSGSSRPLDLDPIGSEILTID